MLKRTNVEIEQPSPDEDKIIIEDDSNKENVECMSAIMGTSSIKPSIISIDSDSDDSVFVEVPESPLVYQRGKFYEKDTEINLGIVNDVAKQVLLQGLDALASATQKSIPLEQNLIDNCPLAISHSKLHVAYHPGSTISLLRIISQFF